MNNACPVCGAVYNVTARDVGRRVACKKCRTPLIVSESGIIEDKDVGTIAEPASGYNSPKSGNLAAPQAGDTRTLAVSRPRSGVSGGLPPWLNGFDVPTIFFSVGVLFVLVFLALPQIDLAAVEKAQAAKTEAKLPLKEVLVEKARLEVDKQKLEKEEKRDNEAIKAKEKAIKDKDKEIEQLRLDVMADEAQAEFQLDMAIVSQRRGLTFNLYGLTLGYLLLSFGSLLFLLSPEPSQKRLLGMIVLAGLLLSLFLSHNHSGIPVIPAHGK